MYENVSNTFAYFAWIVADRLGVPFCGVVGSRIPGRFAIVSSPYGEGEVYSRLLSDIHDSRVDVSADVRRWCDDYINNIESIVPDYMKFNNLDNFSILSRYFRRTKLGKLATIMRHLFDDHKYSFQTGSPLWLSFAMVLRNLGRKIRVPFVRRLYGEAMAGERFLLYPLHYHPESSTSILAGTYLDEYEVIKNIAFSLPSGVVLYVKDHVSAFAYPSLDFYKRLVRLPNVRLLSPFENTKQLIRDSIGVITLTSTVGYESLLLGKRVFLYGSVFYEFHPNVVRVENPARLFELFKGHLDAPLPVGADYNKDFVAAYYLGTFEGVLNFTLGEAETERLLDRVFPTLLREFETRAAQARLEREAVGA